MWVFKEKGFSFQSFGTVFRRLLQCSSVPILMSWMNEIPLREVLWEINHQLAIGSRIHVPWACKLGGVIYWKPENLVPHSQIFCIEVVMFNQIKYMFCVAMFVEGPIRNNCKCAAICPANPYFKTVAKRWGCEHDFLLTGPQSPVHVTNTLPPNSQPCLHPQPRPSEWPGIFSWWVWSFTYVP